MDANEREYKSKEDISPPRHQGTKKTRAKEERLIPGLNNSKKKDFTTEDTEGTEGNCGNLG